MNYFLWPESRFSISHLTFGFGINAALVERRFEQLYPGSSAVLFSSGRAALSILIQALGLGRAQRVWIPPFSSYCVLDAVSQLATPTPELNDGMNSAFIVFHQWGFIHQAHVTGEIIEDSADSLIIPGTPLFPNGGRFELVSLPKTLGTFAGGLVFCRESKDAETLRCLRDNRGSGGILQWGLRAFAAGRPRIHAYWQAGELQSGVLPTPFCADILRRLEQIDTLVSDRQKKWQYMGGFAPPGLHLSLGRLPCNVPIACTSEIAHQLTMTGITSGFRHFNRNLNICRPDLESVFPIPIHQEVPLKQLNVWGHLIGSRSMALADASTLRGTHED